LGQQIDRSMVVGACWLHWQMEVCTTNDVMTTT
jgi:hypothetical protein